MAASFTAVCKFIAWFRDKLPIVAGTMKRELQYTEGVGIPYLAVRLRPAEFPVRVLSAAPDDEFSNSVLGVQLAVRILGRKAFVIVIVSAKDYVGTAAIQNSPQW